MAKRGFLVMVCVAVSWSALAATNVAKDGTLWVGSTTQGDNYRLNVRDGESLSQLDFSGYVAILWDAPRAIDKFIIEQCPGYVIPGYTIQIAKEGVQHPDLENDDHWYTVTSATGVAANSYPTVVFEPGWATAGVRFVADNTTGVSGSVARIREIWAFEQYNNLAPLATFTVADGWFIDQSSPRFGPTINGFNDECTTIQSHSNGDPIALGRQYVYATFDELVTLDSSCIIGGSAAMGEVLIDYKIQYFDYGLGDWATALTVTDNTSRTDWRAFDAIGTSDQWRLYVEKAKHNNGTDNWPRISEIMLFGSIAPVPEPATMTLLALGGLALLRRRR